MRAIVGFVALSILSTACGPSVRGHGDDDDTIDAANPPEVDAGTCAAESAMATEVLRPVDIIWVIDNSGSMDAEEQRIQDNINSFATSIANSGVDYHVIVITDTSHINVPPPLGGSPQFLAINVNIDSHNALQKVVETYPQYAAFLRADSVKHIVPVTDDESDWSRATYESQLAALTAPGFGTDWRNHAVVAEDPPWAFGSHCFALSAAVGQIYLDLRVAHNGLFFSLCDTDWTPLFAALAQSVTSGLALPCTFGLPTPPGGQTLDPNKVNFVYTPTGGVPTTIVNVGNLAGCNGGPGWYYDDPVNPTQIIVCPATCTTLEGDPTGKVDVEFGCSTVVL
jgi:hypothetical protein